MKRILMTAALLGLGFSAQAADVQKGQELVTKSGCVACHGEGLNKPIAPEYPKLAGQHADYLEHALIAYQRGADGANGRGNAIMGGMAKPLSKTEIKDIAAYLSSLPGPLVVRK